MRLEEISKFPTVRFKDIAKRTSSQEYAWTLVHRMVKNGKLKRVAKGVYTASDDAFAIASNIYYPSYISFITASYLYGFTETIPITIYVVTRKPHKKIKIMGYDIEFIRLDSVWGYHKEQKEEHLIFLADVEKLMIDSFLRPEKMGNFTEIENVFKMAEKIDVDKIKEYLKKIDSEMISRKVGYMLERHKGIDISEIVKTDRNYYQLNPFKKSNKIDKKWRLFI